ncbi:MAG: M23 family metallopeptidase [bacterium]|nr:M23 family metallopeptidase [bacterium]
MKKIILPIYRLALFSRLMPAKLPRIDIYKLFTQLLIGILLIGSMSPALYAQETTPLNTSEPTTKTSGSYLSQNGYVDGRITNIQLGTRYWVSSTHRLSRGFTSGHKALDVDGEFHDPIYAMTDGEVIEITTSGPYGNKIVIAHPGNTTTLYAHLQTIDVVNDQTISGGQFIGTMGSTGRSTGSHLHFEVRDNGQLIDPATLF